MQMPSVVEAAAARDRWLREELLCAVSPLLALPSESTFEPLQATKTSVDVTQGSPFSAHMTLPLPCDHGTLASQQHPEAFALGLVDTLHCFTLRPDLAATLNESLAEFALHKESLAEIALLEWHARDENVGLSGQAWIDAWMAGGPMSYDAGVRKTNVGGYQSQADVFEASELDASSMSDRSWACRQLHRICSAAMDELGPHQYPVGEGLPSPPSAADLHGASAWTNVNRSTSYNTLHIHDVGRWSAIYFVADGRGAGCGAGCGHGNGSCGSGDSGGAADRATASDGAGSDGGADAGKREDAESERDSLISISRHLILRGGTQVARASSEAVAKPDPASHCYMTVPPESGTLWLLPGSVPHCVLGSEDCAGARGTQHTRDGTHLTLMRLQPPAGMEDRADPP